MRRFEQYLLPGIVFQSVLIGGAYATGREIVEYGARLGALGLYSIAAIFVGFSVMSVLAFEFARISGAYDYRSFVRALIGPLWPLFDLLFVVMAVLVIAVVGAASGDVVAQHTATERAPSTASINGRSPFSMQAKKWSSSSAQVWSSGRISTGSFIKPSAWGIPSRKSRSLITDPLVP